jgi:uncharacterized protein (TIGR04222 family)
MGAEGAMGSDTWGISGPEFEQLYLVAVIVPALGWEAWKFYARSTSRTASAPGPYELALLAGGRNRVIETAVATLLAQGRLRLSDTGRALSTVAAGEQPTVPAEAAVWNVVAAQPEFADLVYLRFKLRVDPSIAELTAAVVREGLLVAVAGQRRALAVLRATYFLVLLVGCGRVAASVENQRPVSGLITTMAVAGPIVLVLLAITAGNVGKMATRAGEAALSAARRDAEDNPSAATAVVLGGLAKHPDRALRATLLPLLNPPANGSAAGGEHGSA